MQFVYDIYHTVLTKLSIRTHKSLVNLITFHQAIFLRSLKATGGFPYYPIFGKLVVWVALCCKNLQPNGNLCCPWCHQLPGPFRSMRPSKHGKDFSGIPWYWKPKRKGNAKKALFLHVENLWKNDNTQTSCRKSPCLLDASEGCGYDLSGHRQVCGDRHFHRQGEQCGRHGHARLGCQNHHPKKISSNEPRKKPYYFPLNPGWLIGILIMVY